MSKDLIADLKKLSSEWRKFADECGEKEGSDEFIEELQIRASCFYAAAQELDHLLSKHT